MRISTRLVLLSGILISSGSQAENFSLCPPPPEARVSTLTLSGEETRIRADEVSGSVDDSLTFLGEVELENASQWIAADKVTVTSNPRYVIAEDNLQAGSDGLMVSGEKATYNQEEERIEFENVRYQYPQKRLFGRADSVQQEDQRIRMSNASYTTCPSETPAWHLQAKDIDLNQKTDIGTVRHATLRLEGVPVFYLPWASFPLSDRRKTGLLYPHLATTEGSGLEIGVPFYWNIRPNLDNTLMPLWIEDRGLMWDNEFRFLFGTTEGAIRGKYLEDDARDESRHLLRTKVGSHLGEHWTMSLDTTRVSDNNWFDDFSNDLNLTSLSHLARRLDFDYRARHTHFQARLLDYQTINEDIAEEDHPYRLWPRLTYDQSFLTMSRAFDLSFHSELVRFDHDLRQRGTRLDLNPRLSWTWRTPASYLSPRLQWHSTQYELEEVNGFDKQSISRNLPTVSIDSGLFFDRKTPRGNTQTLEPRLFYVYTPYREQSDIPVFDTSDSTFNFYSLFRENHFNGIDRIADANQLTFAGTTRLVDGDSGNTTWTASMGQVLYFEDRTVQLPDVTESTAEKSSYAAEISYDPLGPWSGNASVMVDSAWDSTQLLTLLGRYRGTNGKIINLEYRYREEDNIEQSNISFVWPVHRRWTLMGRWLRSIEDSRDIERIFGVEYNTCCWKTQIVSRRYALGDGGEYNNGIYMQLILKGLSSQGSASDLLRTSITGYKPSDE